MRRKAWQTIAERLGLRRFMSSGRWEALDKEIREGDPPPITEETIATFAEGYLAQREEIRRESIAEVFEWLRPPPWDPVWKLKTNTEFEVGEKVIIGNAVAFDASHTRQRHWSVVDHQSQKLIALENVLHGLAGEGSIAKGHRSDLEVAIVSSQGSGETDLFEFRCFKNRNLHLRFRRPELVARLNLAAGGNRLRPAPGDA